MECPRCGGGLDRYTLDGREARSCGSCGYVGVPVEHRWERTHVESWDEAISRYPDAATRGSVTVDTVDGEPAIELVVGSAPDESDPKPTVIRVDRPDPRLVAAFEAADGDDTVCGICGSEFETRDAFYEHLAAHAGGDESTP